PLSSRHAEGLAKIGNGLIASAKSEADRPPLVMPQRLFSERSRTPVGRQFEKALVQRRFRFGKPADSICGRASLEPQQPITWVARLKRSQDLERLVETPLSVVDQHKCETRVGLVLSWFLRRLLDHADRARLVGAKSEESSNHACRK